MVKCDGRIRFCKHYLQIQCVCGGEDGICPTQYIPVVTWSRNCLICFLGALKRLVYCSAGLPKGNFPRQMRLHSAVDWAYT